MIKINLLPPEVAQKAARRKIIILAGFLSVIVFGIAITIFLLRLSVDIRLATKVAELEHKTREYKKIVEDVRRHREIAARLETKKGIIEKLKKGSLIYPKFVEEFLPLIPSSVWFTSFNTHTTPEGLSLTITCQSLDNFAIADLISNLETSPKFSEVKISAISIGGEPGKEICSFSLSCNYKAEF